MKTIFISILTKSISDDDFGAFWSGLIHTSLAHHLKIQVQLEVNGKVCHKLAEVTESDFDVATQLTSSDDESVFFKSIKYIGSGLKNVPSSNSIELWIISDWTMDDEDAIVDAIDQFQSVRRGIETIYFHAGKENESISAAVTDYYPLSTESCFYAVTRSGETAAGRVSAKKNATFLMFDDDVKVEVDLFRGSKNSPSLSKLVKIESYDETSEQTVKTVTQYTADGMPVDPNDLDIELEIDEETAPVKRGDKSTFQQVFSKDTMSSVTILGKLFLRYNCWSVTIFNCYTFQMLHFLIVTLLHFKVSAPLMMAGFRRSVYPPCPVLCTVRVILSYFTVSSRLVSKSEKGSFFQFEFKNRVKFVNYHSHCQIATLTVLN